MKTNEQRIFDLEHQVAQLTNMVHEQQNELLKSIENTAEILKIIKILTEKL